MNYAQIDANMNKIETKEYEVQYRGNKSGL